MKKKAKNLLSMLLVLAMCFSLALPAYASEGEGADSESEIAETDNLLGEVGETNELPEIVADEDEDEDEPERNINPSDNPDENGTLNGEDPDGMEDLQITQDAAGNALLPEKASVIPDAVADMTLESVDSIAEKDAAATANTAAVTDTGDEGNLCGDGVYWELSADNTTLHIWGSGAMTDYANKQTVPWCGQASTIAQVIVDEGVTHIGKYAFYNYKALSAVSLPSSVSSIGAYSFCLCSALSDISIPAGVVSIGDSAFSSCKSLTGITLPAGITSIGNSVFSGCTGLTGVMSIPEGVVSIGTYAFSECTGLTEVVIPDGVTSIGNSAFSGCSKLAEVSIPDSVTSFGTFVFSECAALTSVVIPEGVTSLGNSMFKGCSALSSVSLPDSLTVLGDSVFNGCSRIVSLTLPEHLTSIGKQAFYNCNYLTGIVLPESLTSIGSQAFYHCSSLQEITVPAGVVTCDSAFYETQLRTVVLAEGFSAIGASMFYNCPKLNSITIPESVTRIGSQAFYGCSSLMAITLPDTLTSLGSAAFEKCTGLSEFIIPSGLTTLEAGLFKKCTSLQHILIPANITSIGNNAFAGSGLRSIVIPDTVTSLGINVFGRASYSNDGDYHCDRLESVVLPSNLTSIGKYLFRGCSSLAEIVIPAGVTSIGDCAFENSGLKSITIPDGVTSIANGTFSGCVLLETITIPSSVTSIGTYSFQFCHSLKDVYFKGTESQWSSVSKGYLNEPLDKATIHCIGTTQYAVAAYTTDTNCSTSVSHVTIEPQQNKYSFDSEVTVTVEPAAGYTFLGWYPVTAVSGGQVTSYADTLLAGTLSYTFKVKEVNQVTAVFQAVDTAKLTVHAVNGAEYTIVKPDGSSVESGADETVNVPLSSTVTLTAKDAAKVLQWENQSQKLLGKSQTLTVTVVGNMDISLVYKTEETETETYVQFVSDYGQVLSAVRYAAGSTVTIPGSPTKFGYTFERWVFEGTEEEATAEAIQTRLGTETVITVKPQYSKDTTVYTLTVSYLSQSGRSIGDGSAVYENLEIGSRFTATAPAIQGYLFSCWKNAAGTVLSYKADYFLQVSGDTALTACYDMVETAAKPVIALGELYTVTSGDTHKVSCSATRSVPDGYTLVEQGMLYARDVSDLTEETFIPGTAGVGKYVSNDTALSGVLKLNVKVAADDVLVSFRGYMILRDNSSGNLETYYTDVASGSYASVNG